MTQKIFYNPKTLKIIGMSNGDSSLEFPYIETAENYHSTFGIEIVMENDKPTIKSKNITIEPQIEKAEGFIRSREERKTSIDAAKEELKEKLKENKIKTLEDLLPLLSKIL